jgi:hypothetical protein
MRFLDSARTVRAPCVPNKQYAALAWLQFPLHRRDAGRKEVTPEMITNKVLVVEGTSDLACLRTLDQRIGRLSARRNAYSQAHELAHHVMAANEADLTGTVVVIDNLLMLEARDYDQLPDWPTSFATGVTQPSPSPMSLFANPPSAFRLPTWSTCEFAGMIAQTWLDLGDGTQATATPTPSVRNPDPARSAPPSVVYYLSVGAGSLIIDSWAAIVRVIDSVLAAMRLMRLLVRAGLRYGLNALTFVLVILAACRHYGHRSEPDDHASLLIRRNLVSMGSCPRA